MNHGLADLYSEEGQKLKEILDAIPFTATQRRNIDHHLNELRTLFVQANH